MRAAENDPHRFESKVSHGCRYKSLQFVENFYIMGYNLKNARNGKCASKIPKWPSLMLLALKSKLIRQFEFSDY